MKLGVCIVTLYGCDASLRCGYISLVLFFFSFAFSSFCLAGSVSADLGGNLESLVQILLHNGLLNTLLLAFLIFLSLLRSFSLYKNFGRTRRIWCLLFVVLQETEEESSENINHSLST